MRVDRDDRRMPHVRSDQRFDGGDLFAVDLPLRFWDRGRSLHCASTIERGAVQVKRITRCTFDKGGDERIRAIEADIVEEV